MLLKNYLNSTHPSLSRDEFFSNIRGFETTPDGR
jgi:hypothetical protein